jgi:hypothetical protein
MARAREAFLSFSDAGPNFGPALSVSLLLLLVIALQVRYCLCHNSIACVSGNKLGLKNKLRSPGCFAPLNALRHYARCLG